jgi:hypothetical protein
MKFFEIVTTLLAFQNIISCSEILEFNRYIRPFLLNQHPIFITYNEVSLPDKNFQTFHAEEISSVLVYDFQKLQIRYANAAYVTGSPYSLFMWTRFPSFIHIFPNRTNEEVYNFQYQFLLSSGLGLTTRPKITSVIITLEHSTVHQKFDGRDLFWRLLNKQYLDTLVENYDFALYVKPEDTKSLKFKLFEISSVSVLKFCTRCSATSKVSLVHFESCEKSPLNIHNNNFNCIENLLQIVSELDLNLTRFGVELEVYDSEGRQTYGSCKSQTILKNDITSPSSNNPKNTSVQNILLEELVRGLPVLHNCVRKDERDLIIMNLRFYPQSNTQRNMYFDFQTSSSLENQEAFNFLTCDGVRQNVDFMGYLEPFDAHTWFATITSLLINSSAIAILVSRSPNTSLVDSCLSSFLMNLSYLTGVANIPRNLTIKNRINTVRILMLSWGITTIVLCSVYSSLVTTNVTAPKSTISPWTEYKQLEKFTKVFGLNNQHEMLTMDEASKGDKSDLFLRLQFAQGSKVSLSWFSEMWKKLYKPKDYSNSFSEKEFQAERDKIFKFVDSYSYVVRSDVQKLKEVLSVCTNTAFIDTETAIDSFLHIWNQDEHLPSMVKGSPFFQQSHSWTMRDTWLFRKLLNFRLKAFTTSGIIGFWERFCLKHCKKQSELSELQYPDVNSKIITFNAQKLGSNISSLFFMLLITLAISILCLLGERFFSLTNECVIFFLSFRTDNTVKL